MRWRSTFLRTHWKAFAASDFFSIEVWTGRGLVTHYVLFVISLADRIVMVLGVTARPDEAWMMQLGRNLVDSHSGALRQKRYVIIDRDSKYTDQFCRLLRESGLSGYPATADVAESECIRRALRSLDQGRNA